MYKIYICIHICIYNNIAFNWHTPVNTHILWQQQRQWLPHVINSDVATAAFCRLMLPKKNAKNIKRGKTTTTTTTMCAASTVVVVGRCCWQPF